MTVAEQQEPDEVWDLLDALEHFNSKAGASELDEDEMASLEQALAYEPTYSPAISIASSGVLENVEVPHLPPLSGTMLGNGTSDQVRTSEPISKGVQQGKEQVLLDMASKQRFELLMKSQMGLTRFEEWVEDEGLPGSKQLLSYYKDIRAYNALFEEVKAIGSGIDHIYLGNQSNDRQIASTSTLLSINNPSILSASLSIHTAQEEATDRLYVAEFKRFISGKLTEQAKARLQFIPDHKRRGDLGEVFCIADPRLPDQPVRVCSSLCPLRSQADKGAACFYLGWVLSVIRVFSGFTDWAKLSIFARTRDGQVCSTRTSSRHRGWTGALLLATELYKDWKTILEFVEHGSNGAVEYLLGAQIDVTSAMSGGKAFQNLQDLVQSGKQDAASSESSKFSPQVLKIAGKEITRPLTLAALSERPVPKRVTSARNGSISYPAPDVASQRKNSFAPSLMSPKLGSLGLEKKSTWLSKLKKGGPDPAIPMDS
uniref:Uncharacterized protein n=1 Tax=Kwoniella pini CBS 10737 TaxID=1296096 RepID=A0A1B9I1K6_9TREE|nr:uncharacterized protein I206_05115 [Kwoniella pini CBS 10737]OCF49422.1 hypothetical protein I206_05115 [Kwoniella pini CBS 10737]